MAKDALLEFLLRLADDHLILGHRVSEWCGHAPMLEEDLSMPNMALDLIGQARALYTYAGEVEGEGRDEDAFAYLRKENQYKNLLLVERPNTDFAYTMVRHLFFASFMELFWEKAIQSSDKVIAGIAAKAIKEVSYHVRHASQWIIRLGDGTPESHDKTRDAVAALFVYTDEIFEDDEVVEALVNADIIPRPLDLKTEWQNRIAHVLNTAILSMPETTWPRSGGRKGQHGEEMGYLLAELQYMQRTFPEMKW